MKYNDWLSLAIVCDWPPHPALGNHMLPCIDCSPEEQLNEDLYDVSAE